MTDISSPKPIFDVTQAPQVPVYNRVPQVTWDFWVVKLLAVTVGETAADFINQSLGLGLSMTSFLMSGVLILALIWQFRQKKYVPVVYWTAVVMISIVGTLISDNLVDNLGYELMTTTTVFSILLAATFIIWYSIERTLSIHSIFTFRREAFYWLAILFTFALGTSAGDQAAEGIGLGYLTAGLIYGGFIALIASAYFVGRLNGILAFWLAYIVTRPMGASFGDYLAQPISNGGLGLGTVVTSGIFLTAIAVTVIYMSLSHDGDEFVEPE